MAQEDFAKMAGRWLSANGLSASRHQVDLGKLLLSVYWMGHKSRSQEVLKAFRDLGLEIFEE